MALRIKSDVDLKELEKYGFEINIHYKWFYEGTEDEYKESYKYARKKFVIIYGSDYEVSCAIGINEKDRIIGFGMVNCKYEYELYKKFVEDTLYDLIKDGLVEKVDE